MSVPGRHRREPPGRVAQYRKLLAAACGLIALALANGLLHGEAAAAANAVLSIATLAGVYKVENKPVRR